MPRKTLAAIAALLAVIAAGGTLILTADPNDHRVAPATITVPVDGLDAGRADDRSIEVPTAAVKQIAPQLEDNLRDPPPATTPEQLAAIAEGVADNQAATEALPTAGATAGFPGCRTSFVNNQSSRGGVRPTQMWDHYTVSANRPGWSDVDAVVALFNRSSSQASSHFVIDTEGNCAYIVPIEAKAWTQAGANRFAISFEIIATGKERRYLEPAGMRKLAAVQREVSRRTGIPMQRGAVTNCVPTKPGMVEHRDGGICAGGHVDISPFSIDAVIREVIQLAGGGCSEKCQRTRDLRKRNSATHAELKRRRCAPPERTRSDRCRFLHRRHAALHAAAKREGVRL